MTRFNNQMIPNKPIRPPTMVARILKKFPIMHMAFFIMQLPFESSNRWLYSAQSKVLIPTTRRSKQTLRKSRSTKDQHPYSEQCLSNVAKPTLCPKPPPQFQGELQPKHQSWNMESSSRIENQQ